MTRWRSSNNSIQHNKISGKPLNVSTLEEQEPRQTDGTWTQT